MNFFKRFFQRFTGAFTPQVVADGFEVVQRHQPDYNYSLFVDCNGDLLFSDQDFTDKKIIGVCEWDADVKQHLAIDKNTIVLDIFIIAKK